MSVRNNQRPAPPTSLFASDEHSADDDYHVEDERSEMEGEDDHSMTEFPLGEGRTSAHPGAAPAAGVPAHDDSFHDDDVRPDLDDEDDHSTADFNLTAEIEARLGPAAATDGKDGSARSAASSAGSAPVRPVTPVPERAGPPVASMFSASPTDLCGDSPDEDDARPDLEDEDDHSMTDFCLTTEITARAGRFPERKHLMGTADGSSPDGALPNGSLLAGSLLDDDERPDMGGEDDHSMTEFSAAVPAGLGSARASGAFAFTAGSASPAEGGGASVAGTVSVAGAASATPARGTGGPEAEDDPDADDIVPFLPEAEDDPDAPEGPFPADAAARPAVPESGGKGEEDDEKESGASAAGGEGRTLPFVQHPAAAPESGEAGGVIESPSGASVSAGKNSAVAVAGAQAAAAKKGDDEEEDEEEEEAEDRPMSLRDHLTELRRRVMWAFLWVLLGFILCWPFAEKIFEILQQPMLAAMPSAGKFIYTSPTEAFFTFMKVAFVGGLFATSPMIFYQVWAFVAPGLYKEEKMYILPVAAFSALFFISGGLFCFFIAFPFAFKFLMSYSTDTITAMLSLHEYLSFVLQLLIAFGLIFELPLFIFFLARIGLVTADMMRRFRRYAILVNVIVAAILTPPDVMSQLLMAAPLLLLYEVSIWIAQIFGRKKAPKKNEDDEDEEDAGDGEKSTAQKPAS